MDWRVAAALTMISVGGLSLAVSRRWTSRSSLPDPVAVVSHVDTTRQQPTVVATAKDTPSTRADTNKPGVQAGRTAVASPKAQLAFAGGVEDLDDASIKALLGALDEIDRAPLAPSAEPDRTPVLPVIRTGER
jgi:hypothetical protein